MKYLKHWCGRKEDKAQTLNQPVGVAFRRLNVRVGPVTHHSDPFTFPSNQSDFSITRQWFSIRCRCYVTGLFGVGVRAYLCFHVTLGELGIFFITHSVTCCHDHLLKAILKNEMACLLMLQEMGRQMVESTLNHALAQVDLISDLPYGFLTFSGLSFSTWKWDVSFYIPKFTGLNFSLRVLLDNRSQSICYQILSAWHYKGGHGD